MPKMVRAGAAIVAALLALFVQIEGGAADGMSDFQSREATMKRMGRALYTGIGRVVKGTAAYSPETVTAAETIASLSKTIDTLFPAGSNVGDSRVRPEIFAAPDRIKQFAGVVQTGAERLVEAAKGGDKAAIAAAYSSLNDACEACHTQFRKAE
jgi:cytochrome c556